MHIIIYFVKDIQTKSLKLELWKRPGRDSLIFSWFKENIFNNKRKKNLITLKPLDILKFYLVKKNS